MAIGADQDAAVKAAIANIREGEWKAFRDGEITETVHCMNKTNKAFRLIAMRRPREQDLFEDKSPYRYHAIASNGANEDAAATMEWYSRRGDASENRIKDLEIGFGMAYMPCGSFPANAVFFAIGALTYNLCLGFRSHALASGWGRSQAQTVRRWLLQTAGKDRPLWPADVLEDQRRHVGLVHRHPRSLRAHHAGRRSHPRNVVIPSAAFSRS